MSDDQYFGDAPPNTFNEDNDDDAAMFSSAIGSAGVNVPLDDDDEDDNPFGGPAPARQKTPTNTTNTVETSAINDDKLLKSDPSSTKAVDDDDDDVFRTKNTPSLTVPTQVPVAKPDTQASQLYPTDLNTSSSTQSAATTTYTSGTSTTTSKPVQKRSSEQTIEITVSDPSKVGDGMSSYMTYRITTKTNLPTFKSEEFSVNRRFSDFLGLHTKLVHKYLHTGIIVPSPPEKDTISTAKVKIAKDDSMPTDFIDRRRALLERYLNRLAQHDKLIEDADFKEFLETPNELPKAKDTQALSGAGVLRALTNISNSVTKLAAKTNEQDQWFEEKHKYIIDLQTHLKQIYNQFDTLFFQRKEAAHALKQFQVSLNHLATVEEHPSLSSALTELANLEEKLEQTNNEYSLKEYSVLTESIKEYISLTDMILLVFNERVKLHQIWLNAEDTLKKKRDNKTKLEANPKSADKIPQAEMEIKEWEEKVQKSKEDFENASSTIKDEMEVFEQTRINDFKKDIADYLKNLVEEQEKILQLWESYLPEANKISV